MLIDNQQLCPLCFEQLPEEAAGEVCGNCKDNRMEADANLPAGTILLGKFIIGKILGKGGFGVTYLAYDLKNSCKVAIKEYMPDTLSYRTPGTTTVTAYPGEKEVSFQLGAEKFYEEAKTVAKFNGHPNIINVSEFFYENNTAYFVMEYIDGMDLKAYIGQMGGRLSFDDSLRILTPIMDALILVHSIGVLHRDISPDNIYITKDGSVKLLDFGAARQVLGDMSKSLSVVLKPGFAPMEQYQTRGKQGAWTDVYALGATWYYCLTGQIPDAAMDRIETDSLKPPSELGAKISPDREMVLLKALSLKAAERFQTMSGFKQAVLMQEEREAVPITPEPLPEPSQRPLRKKFIVPAVAASVVMVLALSLIGLKLSGKESTEVSGGGGGDNLVAQSTLSSAPSVTQMGEAQATVTIPAADAGTAQATVSVASASPIAAAASSEGAKQSESTETKKEIVASETQQQEVKNEVTDVKNKAYTYKTSLFTAQASYTGKWKDNRPEGQGVLIISQKCSPYWSEGDTLSGVFTSGVLNGTGSCKYADGKRYEGQFVNGVCNGFGKYTMNSGNWYEGQVKNDKFNGNGVFSWTNGAKYTGNWSNDVRSGQGTYQMADGSKYIGEWKDDKYNGKGTYIYPDGSKYVGEFKNNKMNGEGCYYNSDGDIVQEGTWSNDEFVG